MNYNESIFEVNIQMKKLLIFLFLFFLLFCRSSANNPDFIESNSIQVIFDGKKLDLTSPILLTNDTLLFPLRNLLENFSQSSPELHWDEKNHSITLLSENNTLVLEINSKTALFNNTPFTLSTVPVLYKNQTLIPLRIVSEFLDCRIAWDNPSKSVFIKTFSDFSEAEEIFRHSNIALKKINSVKMDIINEISYPQGNISFGHSVYIDKSTNTIYTKNILEPNWTIYSQNEFNSNLMYENSLLPFCFSLDKNKSNENTYIFRGFYPSKQGTLSESFIFIDTLTFQLVKLSTKKEHQTQSVLYQYEIKL